MAHVCKGDPTPRTTTAYNRALAAFRTGRRVYVPSEKDIGDGFLLSWQDVTEWAIDFIGQTEGVDCDNREDPFYQRIPDSEA